MKQVSNKELIKTFFRFLESDKKKFIFWNFPVIFTHVLDLISPFIIGLIINFFATYSTNSNMTEFYKLIIILLVVTILQAIFRNFSRGAFFDIQANLEYNIKVRGWENISNNSLDWNSKENSGNKIQRLETGKESVIDFLHFIREDLYYIVINIVSIIAIFISINYLYAIFFGIYSVSYFIMIKYWDRNNPQYLERINRSKELSSGKTFEATNNILSIKSLGSINEIQKNLNTVHNEYKEAFKSWQKLGIYKWSSISIVDLIFLIGFLFIMSFGLKSEIINVGLVFTLYTYFNRLQDIIGDLSKKYTQLIEIKSNISRLIPIFEINKSNFGNKQFPSKWENLIISEATFEYPSEENKTILSRINFEINNKEFIGIIGPSGSGKSTILKLLLGLYSLKAGSISIDNSDYYSYSLDSILSSISVVLQETELFNDSLLNNITMYKSVDIKKLTKAIEVACLNDLIKELPSGINSIIGEKGSKLSGGERQRIGIARAIYKDSPILLMDEATSNLDTNTEKIVIDNILSLNPKKTIIAVAHRLSTLEKANRIYKIENGKLTKT